MFGVAELDVLFRVLLGLNGVFRVMLIDGNVGVVLMFDESMRFSSLKILNKYDKKP
jgi:hypothetical protein